MSDETESAGVPGHPGVLRRKGESIPMRPAKGEQRPGDEKKAGPRRRRLYSLESDKLALPLHLLQDGWSYEWKTCEVYGKEMPWNIQAQVMQGWEPCKFEEFPGFAPDGMTGNFVKEGLMLMKRPQELTDEYNEEVRDANMAMISNRLQALGEVGGGQFERNKNPSLRNYNKVKSDRTQQEVGFGIED